MANCASEYVSIIQMPAPGKGLLNLLIANNESEITKRTAPARQNQNHELPGVNACQQQISMLPSANAYASTGKRSSPSEENR